MSVSKLYLSVLILSISILSVLAGCAVQNEKLESNPVVKKELTRSAILLIGVEGDYGIQYAMICRENIKPCAIERTQERVEPGQIMAHSTYPDSGRIKLDWVGHWKYLPYIPVYKSGLVQIDTPEEQRQSLGAPGGDYISIEGPGIYYIGTVKLVGTNQYAESIQGVSDAVDHQALNNIVKEYQALGLEPKNFQTPN